MYDKKTYNYWKYLLLLNIRLLKYYIPRLHNLSKFFKNILYIFIKKQFNIQMNKLTKFNEQYFKK